ncbi:MAG: patatin-like phospholipase family protein [Candidatus Omnitrophica bacterium]|nr:patatin-like phospholipase family protein [Candidatus Omnitrophota bacterium]
MKKIIIAIILIILALAGWLFFVKGYVGVRKRSAVPVNLIYKAQVPGIKNIRLMADTQKIRKFTLKQLIAESGLAKAKFNNPEINILAISGGGANGAYGAGVLCGWTEAGNRPEFDVVTGVSTGALIAPAAFLGPEYDAVIRDIYTNITDTDIAKQNITQFLFNGQPSLLDTQPLRHLLNHVVTPEVVEKTAREHAKGRRLYIATTNLDARRLVIWDMGAIASSGSPQALELFRNVMLASASIPVAFPPVMITVEAGGKLYDEMHVDGSVATQIIGSLLVAAYDDVKKKKTNVYVIKNGKLADTPEEVPYKVWDIAGAAFSTLMTWQSYGDIYRFFTLAKYERMHFYFTCIPYEFNESRKSEFDLSYMRKLFYRGDRGACSGGYWFQRIGNEIKEGPLWLRSK